MRKRNFEYYCDNIENIENYEAAKKDNFKGWDCHHRLETHNSDGERRLVDITRNELKALDMCYHRPPEELIFLTTSEHTRLHKKGQKRGPRSDETRSKISAANKGKKFSEEHKNKIAEACKGRTLSKETKNKISKTHKEKLINRKDQSKKVLCVETGIVFSSIMEAYRKTRIHYGNISNVCNGKHKTAGGYHWKFYN